MIDIAILAAGKGTRMKSLLPKWKHLILGKPILTHLLQTCSKLDYHKIYIILSPENESEIDSIILDGLQIEKIIQEPALGTGHAVQCLLRDHLIEFPLLILNADCPFMLYPVLNEMINNYHSERIVLLVSQLENPKGYGRIILDRDHNFEGIIEEKDFTQNNNQGITNYCNMGVYLFCPKLLLDHAFLIDDQNASKEFYITDIVSKCHQSVNLFVLDSEQSIYFQGINTRDELLFLENSMKILLSKAP
jgi:bifunctional UDP-N-acetylglucosamine pyrophosphorylase/glucosamine-1-phosphate N-acetyltransferase